MLVPQWTLYGGFNSLLVYCSWCRLKSSNFESGCTVAVLHSLLNLYPPIAPCCSADENRCTFNRYISFLTPVSLLETERPFRIVTPRAKHLKSTICTSYIIWLCTRTRVPAFFFFFFAYEMNNAFYSRIRTYKISRKLRTGSSKNSIAGK
jgi:hypothetical protein